jgi:hypothetical protein
MTAPLLFWILMLLWVVLWGIYRRPSDSNWGIAVPDFVAFLLFLILGWHAFGAPIKF